MVDEAMRVVHSLLELNVLNLQNIERELKKIAVRSRFPQVSKWVMTVARNHIINLEGDSVRSEYAEYTPRRPRHGVHTDMPAAEQLPAWASKAMSGGTKLHFFDTAQPRRRELWQALETIVDWFNATLKPNDPALNRIDRVGFEQARAQAQEWRSNVNENPWGHINDRPPTYKSYPDGYKWVRLVNPMHLKREGELMGHCVAGYGAQLKSGTEIYSLRDAENNPHITVEIRKDGSEGRAVYQMKGKQNAKAVAKYQPYLADFVRSTRLSIGGDASYVDMNAKLPASAIAAPVTK